MESERSKMSSRESGARAWMWGGACSGETASGAPKGGRRMWLGASCWDGVGLPVGVGASSGMDGLYPWGWTCGKSSEGIPVPAISGVVVPWLRSGCMVAAAAFELVKNSEIRVRLE